MVFIFSTLDGQFYNNIQKHKRGFFINTSTLYHISKEILFPLYTKRLSNYSIIIYILVSLFYQYYGTDGKHNKTQLYQSRNK